MPINFNDPGNQRIYAGRNADESWTGFMRETVGVTNRRVADIGCGGGIYSRALLGLGAAGVVGVDYSEAMLQGAAENCSGIKGISLVQGNAYCTGLPESEFDMVLERALIHHLGDLDACFKEAERILKPGGELIVQDRTPEDCMLPGDSRHIRGYFFEKYPRLILAETARRHASSKVRQALERNGFHLKKAVSLWETRRIYDDIGELSEDLRARTGRSLLFELDDKELSELIDYIIGRLPESAAPIVEQDRWTVWVAVKK
ncbi:class I SAM-dependent methyltransferase [Paenibacillus macerans]|uniref:class I SAM-dependent methyltransferase n=1 Tax=Paenibacillus macerans TaxID=44252 RepID=UPI002042240F|nr:class I SAM-dependent methyltransferase [Paenibacillus macerans]MCM3703160.1 class I SAM-dependent methyltransferase [Paenibacillus macerans]